MTNEELAIRLQETTDRSIRNEGRIKKIEGEQVVLSKLATSVAVMAEQLRNMNDSVDALSGKVSVLESRPANRWNSLVDKVIWAAAAAVLTFVFTKIGLGG